jgi:hypothetical protein
MEDVVQHPTTGNVLGQLVTNVPPVAAQVAGFPPVVCVHWS